MQRTLLAGGCYVVSAQGALLTHHANWGEAWLVNRELGADALSMLHVRVLRGKSPVRRFPGSETTIFVMSGQGAVRIGERRFDIALHDGIYVASGEGFAFDNDASDPLDLVMTICPPSEAPEWHESMPPAFRADHPERVVSARSQDHKATGDRFYQLMVDERVGCSAITQFIGQIPLSRAPEHFHHYEETIAVLAGTGFMWTGEVKAPVAPGSVIYLPRGQKHCLECVDPSGLLIAGMFYPSGSPATRYE
jgi:mannose-6-phosphate isomerase-like protein (cupin superfamily)